jgi:uncharacterized protein (DUF3084 family)
MYYDQIHECTAPLSDTSARGMNQLTSIAQSHHRNVDQQVTQIEELQATITAKDEVIAQRDETIIHRED